MIARRLPAFAISCALALLAGCGGPAPGGPVRTPEEASAVARRALAAAHLDEEVVDVERQGDAWIVATRWRETSAAGHLVTVAASNGAVRFERYRTLQLGRRP
jgi:hypothetical protein